MGGDSSATTTLSPLFRWKTPQFWLAIVNESVTDGGTISLRNRDGTALAGPDDTVIVRFAAAEAPRPADAATAVTDTTPAVPGQLMR
jgi:hypothetical protein